MSPTQQPPFRQISDHFREQILTGELLDGARLPAVRELAERWRTTAVTAGRAMTRLQAEGLIRVLHGGAIVVIAGESTTLTPRDRAHCANDHGKIYPRSDRTKVVGADLVQAPDHVAAAFDIEVNTPVIRRTRVTLHEDLPVTLSTSWLSAEWATTAPALLDITARIPGGTIGLIESLTGRTVVSGRDQLCARGAVGDVARELGVGEGAPVLYGRNWWFDDKDEVIEFGEFWVPADRHLTYPYEIERRPEGVSG